MAAAIGDINVEAADTEIGQEAARRLAEANEPGATLLPQHPNPMQR